MLSLMVRDRFKQVVEGCNSGRSPLSSNFSELLQKKKKKKLNGMHIVTNVEGNYKGKKCIYVKNVKVHKIMVNGHLNELLQNICFSSASTVYYCNARLLHTSENKHIVPTNALRLCQ